MKSFPMFLAMTGRRVVIAGGGDAAAQKCRLILKTEARITVLAEALDDELAALAEAGRIDWGQAPPVSASFQGAALVFIATGDALRDEVLHGLAKAAGAVVNVAGRPDLSDAFTPSIVDRDPVVVAIGTEGTAPVLGRQIKTRIEEMLEPRLGDLAALAGRLRGKAIAALSPDRRRDLWRWVFTGAPRAAHARGAEREAARLVKAAIASGDIARDEAGQVALVGAGPGVRDLITLRGVQRLQEADIVFYDRLVDPTLLDLARRDAERVFVGKEPGCHAWPQDKINGVLVAAARQGKRVVRLKCGDPGVFARGAEEAAALADAGIAFEIVPGVTAASAAAAASGRFLTERGVTDSLVLTTGTARSAAETPDWMAHLLRGANVAIYMGVGAAPQIQKALTRAGLADETEVEIVSRAGHADQRIVRCAGRALARTISEQALPNPAMIFLRRPKGTAQIVALESHG